eukprot:TRINITY_DN11876_c0_g1_i1.p3 TRINITY_DN11876_c0_g1~~TRINITY_DN11876_c0_g1_i1.p3  ORF type:complete len:125 (-),score=15.77 TRINITY_DN11876_c0_g1_i1:162-536(-)
MNGFSQQVSYFAYTLRVSLFQEHFALSEEEVVDPLSDKLLHEIQKRIFTNTEIYREIFHCYPDSQIKTYEELQNAMKVQPNLENYLEMIPKIQGFAVEYPLYFLEKENLRAYFTQKEFLSLIHI